MPIKVTLRVKRASLPGQEQGHLRVAKKQRTEIPNDFIKRETLSTESVNKARSVDKDIAGQSGRERNVTDALHKSSSCTSLSRNTSGNQCISKATGDDCADFIVGTSEGTVVSKPARNITPMKTSSGSECDPHGDNLQKKNESVSLNFEEEEEEEGVVPSSSKPAQSKSRRTIVWDTKFEQLQAFKNAHGRTNVPQKYGPLGTWVNEQRKAFRLIEEGKVSPLTDERLAKLNGLHFEFKLPTKCPKASWDTRFQELKEFLKVNGHANVPANGHANVPANVPFQKCRPLGRWVSNQRSQFRLMNARKQSCMTDERLAKLNGINFQFKRQTQTPNASWDTRFQELKEFMKVHGHTNVVQKSGSLGLWVSYQRMQFRLLQEGKASYMTDERLAKLNGINFQFKLYTKTPWDTRFQELKEFKNAHGHTNVCTQSGPLGTWVRYQRKQFRLSQEGKASYMTDERLTKLNGINFPFKLFIASPHDEVGSITPLPHPTCPNGEGPKESMA
eukprot:scaffold69917_cov59-Attheya_sp.AAC.5